MSYILYMSYVLLIVYHCLCVPLRCVVCRSVTQGLFLSNVTYISGDLILFYTLLK